MTQQDAADELQKELHLIIARHDGLHGIVHNIYAGMLLSEEHCANCKETAQSLSALFSRQQVLLLNKLLEQKVHYESIIYKDLIPASVLEAELKELES